MREHDYIVRKYRPQDFTAYVRLNLTFTKSDALGRIDSIEALNQMLNKPGYRAVEDLFVAEVDGAIVGCANVLPELGIGRVVLDYLVHPAYCSGPIPGELIAHAIERAKCLGAKAVYVNISSTELTTIDLLLGLGFSEARCFYELRVDLSKVDLKIIEDSCLVFRHLEPDEEDKLAEIQNRCFIGTWGYDQDTAQHISWWLNFRRNSLDDVILVWKNNSLAGYCWTGTSCGCDRSTGKNKGRIYMLGVAPELRNEGVGRELLLAGLSYIKSKRREIVDITVDNQNVVAVELYSSIGFQLLENTLWYKKVID